jgi:hypothetical protein
LFDKFFSGACQHIDREEVEHIANYRLKILEKHTDIETIEKEIHCGQIEEVFFFLCLICCATFFCFLFFVQDNQSFH